MRFKLDRRKFSYPIIVSALIFVPLVCGPPRSQATEQQNQRPLSHYGSLKVLMKDAIHEQFTFLSFTVWHDESPAAEKLPRIDAAAHELQDLAKEIPAHGQLYL